MSSPLLSLLRHPLFWVAMAFVILIAVWTTAFILAGRVDTTEVPLTPPPQTSPATPTGKP